MNNLNNVLKNEPLKKRRVIINDIINCPILWNEGINKTSKLHNWRHGNTRPTRPEKIVLWIIISNYIDVSISDVFPEIPKNIIEKIHPYGIKITKNTKQKGYVPDPTCA